MNTNRRRPMHCDSPLVVFMACLLICGALAAVMDSLLGMIEVMP